MLTAQEQQWQSRRPHSRHRADPVSTSPAASPAKPDSCPTPLQPLSLHTREDDQSLTWVQAGRHFLDTRNVSPGLLNISSQSHLKICPQPPKVSSTHCLSPPALVLHTLSPSCPFSSSQAPSPQRFTFGFPMLSVNHSFCSFHHAPPRLTPWPVCSFPLSARYPLAPNPQW